MRKLFLLAAVVMLIGSGCVKINSMILTSSAFTDGGMIPKIYSRDAENINPPLAWKNAPAETKSFALVMEDPDVPAAAGVPVWDHWVVWNIPAETNAIPEAWKVVGVSGNNTRGETAYSGPRPPDKEHRYYFRLYALDTMLQLPESSTKAQLIDAMRGHILAEAALMGRFAPTQ